jgi:hypothetical protein
MRRWIKRGSRPSALQTPSLPTSRRSWATPAPRHDRDPKLRFVASHEGGLNPGPRRRGPEALGLAESPSPIRCRLVPEGPSPSEIPSPCHPSWGWPRLFPAGESRPGSELGALLVGPFGNPSFSKGSALMSFRRLAAMAAVLAVLGIVQARPAQAANHKKTNFAALVSSAPKVHALKTSPSTGSGGAATIRKVLQRFVASEQSLFRSYQKQVLAAGKVESRFFVVFNRLLKKGVISTSTYLSDVSAIETAYSTKVTALKTNLNATLTTLAVQLNLIPATSSR